MSTAAAEGAGLVGPYVLAVGAWVGASMWAILDGGGHAGLPALVALLLLATAGMLFQVRS